MDRNGSAFKYLAEKFPSLSEAKIKEGSFFLWILGSASSSETICSTKVEADFYRYMSDVHIS